MSEVNDRETATELPADPPEPIAEMGLTAEEVAAIARDLADPLGAAIRRTGHRLPDGSTVPDSETAAIVIDQLVTLNYRLAELTKIQQGRLDLEIRKYEDSRRTPAY